jgi:hypothetical protein
MFAWLPVRGIQEQYGGLIISFPCPKEIQAHKADNYNEQFFQGTWKPASKVIVSTTLGSNGTGRHPFG